MAVLDHLVRYLNLVPPSSCPQGQDMKKDNLPGLPQLYTSEEISDWLMISRERLYTLISTAEFPVIKVSRRRLRFSRENVLRWLRKKGWEPIDE